MGYFSSDGATGNVTPVVLSVKGGELIDIYPTSYNASNRCKMIGSPSEAGQMQFDNRVILPSRITFTGVVKFLNKEVIDEIRSSMAGATLDELKCEFQGKDGHMENMIIETLEEIGESNRYDGIEVRVTLQEYLEHNVSSGSGSSSSY